MFEVNEIVKRDMMMRNENIALTENFMNELAGLVFPRDLGPEKLTAQEKTYQQLRYAIMIGSLAPGIAVTIRGLSQALDVSPTPIREALRRLCAEGALEVLDNRRVMTPEMNKNRFEELISLRTLIECHAAERAMPYVNEVLIDKMEEIDGLMDQEIQKNHHEGIVTRNQQFHSVLYKANPNQVIMPTVESIWLQLGPYTRVALSQLSDLYLVDHHKEAINALRKRDAELLRKAIADDIEDGIGQLGRLALQTTEYPAISD